MQKYKHDLERIIAENRALIGAFSLDSKSVDSLLGDTQKYVESDNVPVNVPANDDWEDMPTSRFVDIENRRSVVHESSTLGTILSKADILRLNDALRASGLAPSRRDADVRDVVDCALATVAELSNRNRTLLNMSSQLERTIEKQPASSRPIPPKVKPPVISQEPVVALADYNALVEENRRISQIAQRFKTEAGLLERSMKLKTDEIERLSTQLRSKCKSEDQRTALAMSTIRDNRMPHSTLLVIENYQKRISSLEEDNGILIKRNSSLTHRLKLAEDDRQRAHALMKSAVVDDAETENLKEEICTLRGCIEELEAATASKTAKIAMLESKYYDMVESQNSQQKKDSHAESLQQAIRSIASTIGCPPNDLGKVVEKVKRMESVLTGPVVEMEKFIADVTCEDSASAAGEPSSIPDLQLLTRKIRQNQVKAKEFDLVDEILSQLDFGDANCSMAERMETLIRQASSETVQDSVKFQLFTEIVHHLLRIFSCKNPSDLVSVANRVVFRLEEFSNFFKRLCDELGGNTSFDKCLEVIAKLKRDYRRMSSPSVGLVDKNYRTGAPVIQAPNRQRISSSSSLDSSHHSDEGNQPARSDLALAREIVRITANN